MANRQQRRAAPKRTAPSLITAQALAAAGRVGEAFAMFEALRAATRTPAVLASFGEFLIGNTPAAPHPAVDALFVAALDEAWLRPEAIVPAIAAYLFRKSRDPLVLARDPLLHALLRATPAATPDLEAAVSDARAAVAEAYRAGRSIESFVPFLAALGEREMLSGFALVRAEGDGPVADHPALAATYAPLGSRPADPRLAGVVRAQIDEPAEEAAIAAALPAVTTLAAGSAPVAAHYEEAPYPRWRREPRGAPPPPVEPGRVREVLVAGCGTGQHALLAAERWPRADILAIDLSRASLAYAARQAGARGRRITFAVGDLLRIAETGRRFDAIEAVGVLHHLADPAAGLAALRDALAPGGVMLVALYARAARARLAEVRARTGFADARAADDVRAFRAAALALDVPEIVHSPDFYSVGGVRDLVFHPREHAYALPEIADMVADAGLRVLRIESPASWLGPAPRDLAGWAAAEAREPLLFGAMIHLWLGHAKRHDGAGRRR